MTSYFVDESQNYVLVIVLLIMMDVKSGDMIRNFRMMMMVMMVMIMIMMVVMLMVMMVIIMAVLMVMI